MKIPWMSIIIPMYNPPLNQLKICLESLRAITLQVEIILVNDGSNKEIEQFCIMYNDERIRYIYQENQGVSSARNKGIEMASGKYVFFLDADDFIPLEFCEFINKNYKYIDADWVLFNVIERNPENGNIKLRDTFQQERNLQREDLLEYIYPDNKIPESWGKLIKKSLLISYEITVPVGVIQGEDAIFNKRIAAVAKTIKIYTCYSYVYNFILQNNTRLARQPEKYLMGLKESLCADLTYIEAVAKIERMLFLKNTAYANFIWNMGSNMIKLCKNDQFNPRYIAIIYKNLEDTKVLKMIRAKDIQGNKTKLYYFLFKYQLWYGFKILSLFK